MTVGLKHVKEAGSVGVLVYVNDRTKFSHNIFAQELLFVESSIFVFLIESSFFFPFRVLWKSSGRRLRSNQPKLTSLSRFSQQSTNQTSGRKRLRLSL